MNELSLEIAYGTVVAAAGAALASVVWGYAARAAIRKARAESAEAQSALVRLHQLTVGIAADVDQHSDTVQKISEDLQAETKPDAELILKHVRRVVDANQQMRERLSQSEKRLREQSQLIESQAAEVRTDPLTRVLNRRGFDEELNRRHAEFKRHGTPFSLILLDIDHFKRLNDERGHLAGDEVLRGVAGVLRQTMREIDLVARFGGEEFAVVLLGTSLEDALVAAERARQAIAEEIFRFEGVNLAVTASFGVGRLRPSERPSSLVRRVDEALYAAKQAGRNNTHWHDDHQIRPAIAIPPSGKTVPPRETDRQTCARTSTGHVDAGNANTGRQAMQVAATDSLPPTSPHISPCRSNELSPPQDVKLQSVLNGVANRTEFCRAVQCRLGEWKRCGNNFFVVLVSIVRFEPGTADGQRTEAVALTQTLLMAVYAVLREMDLLAEFVPGCLSVLLPSISRSDAVAVAYRLRRAIQDCFRAIPDESKAIRIDAGLAEAADGDDMVRLLKRAEEALHSARTADHGDCFWHNGQLVEPVADLASISST